MRRYNLRLGTLVLSESLGSVTIWSYYLDLIYINIYPSISLEYIYLSYEIVIYPIMTYIVWRTAVLFISIFV